MAGYLSENYNSVRLKGLELGRLPKGDEPKSANLSARLTKSAKERIVAIAKSHDMKPSEFLEALGRGEFVIQKAS